MLADQPAAGKRRRQEDKHVRGPGALTTAAEVYHWPVDRRERNALGRVGKLHAKFALIDDTALVSSANLTDDAFNRNLEVGVMLHDPAFCQTMRAYVSALITDGTLQSVG